MGYVAKKQTGALYHQTSKGLFRTWTSAYGSTAKSIRYLLANKAVYNAIGRRKDSIARIYLTPGKGNITINDRPFKDYVCRESLGIVVTQPLDIVGQRDSYDISIIVKGGGLSGQAGAIRLGIARALNQVSADFRPALKEAGF